MSRGILVAALVLSAPVMAQQVGGSAVIRGRVIAADTGLPIRHARIEVVGGPSATTDDRGDYEVGGLAAGTHIVIAWPPKDKAMYRSARRLASGVDAWVDVAEGQAVEHVDFALPRAGAISGRVLDEFGQPIAGMDVMACELRLHRLLLAGRGGSSDDEGRFRVWGLPPGTYYLRASGATAAWSADARQNGETYLRTFYPNTTSASSAVPITLGPAEERQNVDIRVVWNRTFTVGGLVTGPAGRPAAGATVALEVPVEGAPDRRRTASDAGGRFHFNQVVPGDYALSASQSAETSGTGPLASRAHRITVTVADQVVPRVSLRGGRPIRVRADPSW